MKRPLWFLEGLLEGCLDQDFETLARKVSASVVRLFRRVSAN